MVFLFICLLDTENNNYYDYDYVELCRKQKKKIE